MIYYGQTSCESDLDRYLESLKTLWRRRSQSRETPIVINTMGWVKGRWREIKPTIRNESLKHRVNVINRPQGLGSSCLSTWCGSSQSHTWCSCVTVGSPSVRPWHQSFFGLHKDFKRTRQLRLHWMSLHRAKAPPKTTPTSWYSQSFKV